MRPRSSFAIRLLFVFAVGGFSPTPAQAVLIDNATTTIDTVAGLEWLDVTAAQGRYVVGHQCRTRAVDLDACRLGGNGRPNNYPTSSLRCGETSLLTWIGLSGGRSNEIFI